MTLTSSHARPAARRATLMAAMLVAATLAVAGPSVAAGGPGRGGPMAAGGPPMAGGLVEHVLASLKDKLALDTSQQVMFDRATTQTIAARDQVVANREGIRAKVDAELIKAEPDLAAIATLFEGAEDQGRSIRHQVRDQWLSLYANLRPDQKAIVRDAIKARIAHMDGVRQRMHDRPSRSPT